MMEPEKENLERQYMYNESFEIFEKFKVAASAHTMHNHNYYEIILLLDGSFNCLVESATYRLKKGDILLLNSNVMHRYQYEEGQPDSRRIVLWITQKLLNRLSGIHCDLSECFRLSANAAYHFSEQEQTMLSGHLFQILHYYRNNEENPESELLCNSYLTIFFIYLNQICRASGHHFSKNRIVNHDLVHQVSNYIDEHITEPITIDELADYTILSKFYFLRTFKALTGTTVHNYIIKRRLIKACDELYNNCPISEVYQKCGFTDYSSFFRNFKKMYGISPRQFIQYQKENQIER